MNIQWIYSVNANEHAMNMQWIHSEICSEYAIHIHIIRIWYIYYECNEYVNVMNVIRYCCTSTNVGSELLVAMCSISKRFNVWVSCSDMCNTSKYYYIDEFRLGTRSAIGATRQIQFGIAVNVDVWRGRSKMRAQ